MTRQSPIRISFVVLADHVNSVSGFNDQFAQLDNFKKIALEFNAKLTVLLSGSFANRVLTEGQVSVFQTLTSGGHECGTYVTPHVKIADNAWQDVSSQIPKFPQTTPRNDALMFRIWADNTSAVNAVIGSTSNKTVHSEHFLIAAEEQLVTNNGFSRTFANRAYKGSEYFGHPVEFPFRPSSTNVPGYELKEQLSTQFVFIDGFSNIVDSGDPFACPDLRPVNINLHFLNRYKQWLGVEDNRIWSFAFATSLSRTDLTDEVRAIFSTMSNYVGKITPSNELIAKYTTIQDVISDFSVWESTHPNISSFSFVRVPQDLRLPDSRLHVDVTSTFVESFGARRLFSRIHKPVSASSINKKPGIVIISGDGAITPGLSPHQIAQLGFVVINYDRAGKGQSSGDNDLGGLNDQDDLQNVADYLRRLDYVDINNIGIISLGYGLVIAAGTLKRYPSLKIQYLVDWEGPSNRTNISHFDTTEDFSQYPLTDNTFWDIREPSQTIRSFTGRYLRVQGNIDHFQGTSMVSALEMINSATSSNFGGHGSSALTRLNGNAPNKTYDIANLSDSSDNPILWIQGQSVNRIAEDNAHFILKYFKNIANYARLGITLAVTVPANIEFQQNAEIFRTAALRLRRLSQAFLRAKAKLSVFVENTFIEGSRIFGDNILFEMHEQGHSVGSLVDIPPENLSEHDKQHYVLETKTNLDTTIGFLNNISVMGALSLSNPNYLAEIGFRGLIGPLLNTQYNLPRSAIIRTLDHEKTKNDPGFTTADDPFGQLFYLPGDLSKISLPNGIVVPNTQRATNSIVISRNLIDPNRINSWYIFLDIGDFTSNDSAEIGILERWATQDIGLLVDRGEVEWRSANDSIVENVNLIDREKIQTPTAPRNLKAVPADHLVTLSWDSSESSNVAGYVILRTKNSFGKNYVAIGTTIHPDPKFRSLEPLTFYDTKASNGTEYCYVVKAYTVDSQPIFSEPSNEICAIARDSLPPAAPEITDIIPGNKSVVISWTQTSSPDTRFFRIYRYTVDASNPLNLATIQDICDLREKFQLVAEVDADIFRFVDTALMNNQQYVYLVSAVDSAGNEAFDISNAMTVIPFENLATVPLWVGTALGVSETHDKGASFATIDSCGPDFNTKGEPQITFNTPHDRDFVIATPNLNISLNVVDNIRGIQMVQVGIGSDKDLKRCDRFGATYTTTLDASIFPNGATVPIFAVVTNSIGVVTRKSITVQTLDIAGPQVTIISPLPGDIVTTAFTMQIEALDPTRIQSVNVQIGSNSHHECAIQIGNCNFWYLPVSTIGLSGPLTLSVQALDIANQLSNPQSVTVNVNNTLDNIGPQITVLTPYNNSEISQETLFQVEAVDPSGVGSVQIQFNGGIPQNMIFSMVGDVQEFLLQAQQPYWSMDGTKITYIHNKQIWEVAIDDNGRAGIPRNVFNNIELPVNDIDNLIENGSFEDSLDSFNEPPAWEINADPNAAYIILDAGVNSDQLSLNNVFVGTNRINPPKLPIRILLEPGNPLSEGAPTINVGGEIGLFIWHQTIGTDQVWNIAATSDGPALTIHGVIVTNYGIANANLSGITTGTTHIHIGNNEINFSIDLSNTLQVFTFETPSPVVSLPEFAAITNQAADGINALRLNT